MSDPPFQETIPDALADLSTVAAAILTADGEIVAANRGFADIVEDADEADRRDARPLFLSPTFDEIRKDGEAGNWTRVYDGLLNVGEASGAEATSLSGTVHARADRLVVLAEQDVEGDRRLRDRVLELNRALNEAQRDMRRELEAHKETERELQARTEALERSNERLEEFAYVVSHDLQEPLRTVTSFLQLLQKRHEESLDEDARQLVDQALEGATRMAAMIEDLLTYARVDSQDTQPTRLEASEVVETVLESLARRIEETGGRVEVGRLPAVVADRSQFERLVQNLVSNALEHAGPQPRVEIDATREEGWVRFSVADDGPGIPEAEKDRLFEVFERGSEASGQGTGIGLAVCRRIVERHGGEIDVSSEEGAGTTFHFTLPAPASETSPRP